MRLTTAEQSAYIHRRKAPTRPTKSDRMEAIKKPWLNKTTSSSGYIYVYRRGDNGKYVAKPQLNGVSYNRGANYDTPEKAHEAVKRFFIDEMGYTDD